MMKICPECLERVDQDLQYCPEDGTELREIHAREEDPMEGRVLEGKWVIESKIGGGGMGTVYRAHQLSVNRTVAVKLLRSDLSESDEHVQRFFREANVASKVADARCVTIFDFGQAEEDHLLYIAMEYLDGDPLHNFLADDKLTVAETAEVGIQIASALEALHGQGVVHRDLKPENVFVVDELGADVSVKLLDFGLAKVAQSDATPVTQSGQVFGTPAFMSPEQCMGSEVGPKSDLYSLGCLLYELVTGTTPFESNVAVEVLLAHVNRPPPPVDETGALPVGYADLIMDLLEKDPNDRPGSAVEVRERLQAVRTELTGGQGSIVAPDHVEAGETPGRDPARTVPAEPTDPPMEVDGEGDAPEAPPNEETIPADEPSDRSGRGRRRLIWVAAVAGTLGLASAIYAVGGVGEDTSAESKPDPGPTSDEIEAAVAGASDVVRETAARAHSSATAQRRGETSYSRAVFLAGARARDDGETSSLATGGGSEPAKETGARKGVSGGEEESEDAGSSQVVPFMTKRSMRKTFRRHSPEIIQCIEKHLSIETSSVVSVELELVATSKGEVDSAKVTTSGFTEDGAKVGGCAKRRALTWSFAPTGDGRRARLGYTYRYRPTDLDLD